MTRTLKVELSDKQYAALVMRLQRLEMPEVPVEEHLAQLSILHGEAEAKTIERIEVYEDPYGIYTASSHAKATSHAIFGPAARSPIRPVAPASLASFAS